MRAVSTVLDVSVCLLFVAASAMTLAGTPVADRPHPDAAPDSADATVEILATTTASVSYGVGDRNRTAHDTLAGLLASGVLADPSRASTVAFRNAVTRRVARTLRHLNVDAQVVADATPESGSNRDSDAARDDSLVVGPSPPPTADVHAAGVRVRGIRLTVRTWSG